MENEGSFFGISRGLRVRGVVANICSQSSSPQVKPSSRWEGETVAVAVRARPASVSAAFRITPLLWLLGPLCFESGISNFEFRISKSEGRVLVERPFGVDTQVEEKSKKLFGGGHRARVLDAIARSASGEVTTTALSKELDIRDGTISKELKLLVEVGLLERGQRSGETPYRRIESAFWSSCRALVEAWRRSEEPSADGGQVIPLRR